MINQNNLHNDLLFLKNSSTVSFGYGNAQCGNNDPCEKQRQFCGAETRQHQTQTECHGKLAFAIAFPQPFAWHFHCCSLLTLFTLSYDDSKFVWLFFAKRKSSRSLDCSPLCVYHHNHSGSAFYCNRGNVLRYHIAYAQWHTDNQISV